MESRREWRRKLQVAFYNQQATRRNEQSPQAQRGRAATAPQDRPLPASARGTAAEVTPGGEGDGRSKSNARRKQPSAAGRAAPTSRTQPFESTKADPNDSDDTVERKHLQRLVDRDRGPAANSRARLIHQEFDAYGGVLKYMVGEIAKLVFEVGDSVLGRRYDKGGRATGESVGATIVAIDGWFEAVEGTGDRHAVVEWAPTRGTRTTGEAPTERDTVSMQRLTSTAGKLSVSAAYEQVHERAQRDPRFKKVDWNSRNLSLFAVRHHAKLYGKAAPSTDPRRVGKPARLEDLEPALVSQIQIEQVGRHTGGNFKRRQKNIIIHSLATTKHLEQFMAADIAEKVYQRFKHSPEGAQLKFGHAKNASDITDR